MAKTSVKKAGSAICRCKFAKMTIEAGLKKAQDDGVTEAFIVTQVIQQVLHSGLSYNSIISHNGTL